MDKNKYTISIVGNSKVLISKYQKQAFISQPENRKYALFIEIISDKSEYLLYPSS